MIDEHGPSQAVTAAPDWAILVVDDNAAKRLALRVLLAPLGHPVVEADSGRAALRAVTHQRFAVILMDVRMPTLDGLETAKLIRERPESARTPIIFVTGFGRDEVQTAVAYADGAVDFIFAPILAHVLHAKVNAFVDLFVQADELRRSLESVSALNAGLRESEQRARAVLLNVADGIVTSGEDGRIESINGSARRMFDYPEEELVGEPLSRIVANDIAGEPVGVRKDGSNFPLELDASALRIDGRTSTISCVRDVSARKLAETDRAGEIAHDFNNLLTVIGGYTDELVTRLDGQPALGAAVEEIRLAADRAIALTAQLFSQPAAEGLPELLQTPSVDPDTALARGTETILVVEADDSLRRLIRLMLTASGYAVLDAANGSLALEVCDRHPGEIHLVLTDTVMRGLSGPELSHQLLARRPGIKLLLMPGYGPRALDDRGDAAVLQKPFTSADLARATRTLLDRPEQPPLDRSALRL